ncbi:TPA: hypothetical protein DIS56_02610 [Candidatus Saccharibacteria bacterium]|nr:MAG: hypothetical protein UX30_C0003G0127 [Candidatus Saccharibacteria bacterium GW2011_GWA2_46_10]OGL36309.1 MAG: hypothetical protein A3F05_03290 [Candidatus Saccharibacteria bacterium RIFCSPHIGHO2_12_FULL_47_17]HCM52002.1 hypothetical protein [Candidatus Saccharibacteria bacterium]
MKNFIKKRTSGLALWNVRQKRTGKVDSTGFTIIEVLIVLAIAGLILSIVFIAVPQLQRNARDSKRQSVANRLSSELGSFSANNQGAYPWVGVNGNFTSCATANNNNQSCYDWHNRYINGKVNIQDPTSGSDTTIFYANTGTLPAWSLGNVWISVGAVCNGDRPPQGATGASATSKQYALTIALERSNTYYCVDNG